jgi:hypothetical protein
LIPTESAYLNNLPSQISNFTAYLRQPLIPASTCNQIKIAAVNTMPPITALEFLEWRQFKKALSCVDFHVVFSVYVAALGRSIDNDSAPLKSYLLWRLGTYFRKT